VQDDGAQLATILGDVYTCDWRADDPAVANTWPDMSGFFEGAVTVTFNVFDRAGNRNDAPNGARTIHVVAHAP
jgi:hypothetical protein